jgi:hypothetical protein
MRKISTTESNISLSNVIQMSGRYIGYWKGICKDKLFNKLCYFFTILYVLVTEVSLLTYNYRHAKTVWLLFDMNENNTRCVNCRQFIIGMFIIDSSFVWSDIRFAKIIFGSNNLISVTIKHIFYREINALVGT